MKMNYSNITNSHACHDVTSSDLSNFNYHIDVFTSFLFIHYLSLPSPIPSIPHLSVSFYLTSYSNPSIPIALILPLPATPPPLEGWMQTKRINKIIRSLITQKWISGTLLG